MTAIISSLGELYCLLFGTGWQSQLVAIVSGLAVLIYFTMLALNENGSSISSALRIVIVICALSGVTSIVSTLFGLNLSCGAP